MSETNTVSPLRQRMIEDMTARKLDPHTQRSHIYSCKRFTAWLKRSPDTATAEEVRRFQLHLVESGASICNRNRIVTGVRFLFRVTLRRHDLAAEIWHIKEPQKLPPVLSPEEIKRVLTMATSLKARAMLSLAYGCGLRASEVARLRVCDIDSEQMIIRVVQSKGRKDRNVMLPPEILDLLRQWWKARPKRRDAGVAPERRWLFPGRAGHLTTRQFGRLFKDAAKAAGLRKAVSLHSKVPNTRASSRLRRPVIAPIMPADLSGECFSGRRPWRVRPRTPAPKATTATEIVTASQPIATYPQNPRPQVPRPLATIDG